MPLSKAKMRARKSEDRRRARLGLTSSIVKPKTSNKMGYEPKLVAPELDADGDPIPEY